MAYYSYKSIVFLISALIFSVTTLIPPSHGLAILGNDIDKVQIQGILACSATGKPAKGGLVGAAGVIVHGTCNGGSGSLGMAVTNTTGFFLLTLNAVEGILFGPETPCFAVVQLPVTGSTCKAFVPTGVLQAPISLLTIVKNTIGGLVAVFSAGEFSHIPS